MSLGPIGLHGGGELTPGDDAFGEALFHAAAEPARARGAACRGDARGPTTPGAGRDAGVPPPDAEPIRVVVMPTAAARQHPERSAADGVLFFERLAASAGIAARVEVALVVDRASAGAPAIAGRIAAADLVYLPGGDPDVIPALVRGSLAWQSMLAARARGAVLAGASAGAMALAARTWTRSGWVDGLDAVRGVAVYPHASPGDDDAAHHRFGDVPAGLGRLELPERTGVIGRPELGPDGAWEVVGERCVRWTPPGGTAVVACPGQSIRIG